MISDFITSAFIFVIALLFYRRLLKLKKSRSWPTVEADIVEQDPQSIFEQDGRWYYLNLDSDHFIEYTVLGKKYREKYDCESNIRLLGIKIWRKKPDEKNILVRYNPKDPSDMVISSADTPLTFWMFVILISFMIGMAIYIAI